MEAELWKGVHEFAAFSHLLIASQLAKASRLHGETQGVSFENESVSQDDRRRAAPREASREVRQALLALADFIHQFLEMARGEASRDVIARQTPRMFSADLRDSVVPDFPERQMRRFLGQWDQRWATGLSDDLWDLPGFARLMATDSHRWAEVVASAPPAFRQELEHFTGRMTAIDRGTRMAAVLAEVADALFDLEHSLAVEIDASRLDINAPVLRLTRA